MCNEQLLQFGSRAVRLVFQRGWIQRELAPCRMVDAIADAAVMIRKEQQIPDRAAGRCPHRHLAARFDSRFDW